MAQTIKTLIIGDGLQGIATAVALKHSGCSDFKIVGSGLGGTWRGVDYLILKDLRTPHSAGIDPDGTPVDMTNPIDRLRVEQGHFVACSKDEFQLHVDGVVVKYELHRHHVKGTVTSVRMHERAPYVVTVDSPKGIKQFLCENIVIAVGLGTPRIIPGNVTAQKIWNHPLVFHSHRARDIDKLDLDGKRVAIAGGGITGLTLAIKACEEGADVDVYARSPIRVNQLEVSSEWQPSGGLFHMFRQMQGPDGPRMRLQYLKEARAHSTVTPDINDAYKVCGATTIHAGVKKFECFGRRVTVLSRLGSQNYDYLFMATGYRANFVRSTPFISDLHLRGLIETIGGRDDQMFPILDNDSMVPGLPGVYVAGRYASLCTGPLAGNMPGALATARLITKKITAAKLAA